MPRLTHDDYYLEILSSVSRRSTCVRRAVGAIIVDDHHRILSTGYNGVPSGFDHCTSTACPGAEDPPGDTRRCLAVHAEQNALLQCHRLDLAHKIYVSASPCFTCIKMLLNTRIQFIVAWQQYADGEGLALWKRRGRGIIIAK